MEVKKERNSYRDVYKAHRKGWDHLTNPCIDLILDCGGRVDQVKEKFGGLRIYYSNIPSDMHDLIDMKVSQAEHDSYITCEDCGERGKLHSVDYWWRTLCPSCLDEARKFQKEWRENREVRND